ncbi:MAG: hypothetical protein R2799_00535 [Crocinitomicaceae bacterium]
MSKLFVYSIFLFVISGCSQDSNKSGEDFESKGKQEEIPPISDYFYPKDTTAYIYVYQNIKNPDDQYIERVIYREIDGVDHFFISRFNSKMEPRSMLSYWIITGNIELMKANMMVGKVSYECKIKNGRAFPNERGLVANTTYDFPLNDSLIQVIEINRKFKGLETIDANGTKAECMVYLDSIRLTNVDVKNQKESLMSGYMETYFEKGIGKVLEKNQRMGYRLILRTTADQFAKLQ